MKLITDKFKNNEINKFYYYCLLIEKIMKTNYLNYLKTKHIINMMLALYSDH